MTFMFYALAHAHNMNDAGIQYTHVLDDIQTLKRSSAIPDKIRCDRVEFRRVIRGCAIIRSPRLRRKLWRELRTDRVAHNSMKATELAGKRVAVPGS